MATLGPWYISAAAVRDYLKILGLADQTDGPDFERAERQLIEFARHVERGEQRGKPLPGGLVQFRGPRPHRVTLLLSYAKRAEGTLPQLVAVKPEHAGWRPR